MRRRTPPTRNLSPKRVTARICQNILRKIDVPPAWASPYRGTNPILVGGVGGVALIPPGPGLLSSSSPSSIYPLRADNEPTIDGVRQFEKYLLDD